MRGGHTHRSEDHEAAAARTEVVLGLVVAVVDAAGRPNADLRIVGEAVTGHRELPNVPGTIGVVGVGNSDAGRVWRTKDILRQEPAVGHTVVLCEWVAVIMVGTQGPRDALRPQRVPQNGRPAHRCTFVTYRKGKIYPLQDLGTANRHV